MINYIKYFFLLILLFLEKYFKIFFLLIYNLFIIQTNSLYLYEVFYFNLK